MSSPLILAPTGHPPVPADQVLIEVQVDYSRCSPPAGPTKAALDKLAEDGLEVPISRIVAFAAKHFTNAYEDHWGVGPDRALIQRAWESIVAWRPHRRERKRDRAPKLVVSDLQNSREKAHLSEVLAVGVGLLAASEVYDIPYRFWHPTPGLARTDFRAPSASGYVQLEVRGRFNHTNWGAAIEQVHSKFGARPSLASQLGAVFAPRTKVNTRASDLMLVDPPGSGEKVPDDDWLRALLFHYAPFFRDQGFVAFGARLLELATAGINDFRDYLARGDDVLRQLDGRQRAWTTSFRLGRHQFMGTSWSATVPRARGGFEEATTRPGFIVWGIWRPLLDALISGDLAAIAGATLEPWSASAEGRDAGTVYTVLEDGTALAWAPTRNALVELP